MFKHLSDIDVDSLHNNHKYHVLLQYTEILHFNLS